MPPSDDENSERPPESGRLDPEELVTYTGGDYVRVNTEDTDAEASRAEHDVGDGDLYCVTQVAYRSEIPDLVVKPVSAVGEWPEADVPSFVIVATEYGVALAKEGDAALEFVQPVDDLTLVETE